MTDLLFKEAREYLQFDLELRKQRRPSYSMRAFSRDLKMSPSGLNDFLKGRVGMSSQKGHEVAQILGWNSLRTEHFLDLLQANYGITPALRKEAQLRVRVRFKDRSQILSLDEFKCISNWYHLVILEVVSSRKGDLDLAGVAKILQLPHETVKSACRRLKRLNLLKEAKNGALTVSEDTTWVGDEAPSEAIRQFHSQMLERSQNAIDYFGIDQRESLSLVFSIDPRDVTALHKEVRRSIEAVVFKFAAKANASSVRALTLHTFPISNEEDLP